MKNYDHFNTNIHGTKFYYLNNLSHRVDGPAVETLKDANFWYLNGQKVNVISQKEFEKSEQYRKWKLISFW